jgi:hypothetical protein
MNNIENDIEDKFNFEQNPNLKSKQKIINGRNIAMMRQKASNEVIKILPANNNNYKIKNNDLNNNVKIFSKSKILKREKELLFDNKSVSEKANNYEHKKNRNSNYNNNNNKLYPSENNDNVFMYSNLNNKLISNNSNSIGNISNLNSSYENPNNNFKNNINLHEHFGHQTQSNNSNLAFMKSSMSNIFSNNDSVKIANLENNNFNYNQ